MREALASILGRAERAAPMEAPRVSADDPFGDRAWAESRARQAADTAVSQGSAQLQAGRYGGVAAMSDDLSDPATLAYIRQSRGWGDAPDRVVRRAYRSIEDGTPEEEAARGLREMARSLRYSRGGTSKAKREYREAAKLLANRKGLRESLLRALRGED